MSAILRTVILLVVLAATVSLSACGKRTEPVAPPDEPHTYPRSYPAGS